MKRRTVKAWGGFSDDELHVWWLGGESGIAVFRTRADARREYRDVRPVTICMRLASGSRKTGKGER